jgi:hypothetical protein
VCMCVCVCVCDAVDSINYQRQELVKVTTKLSVQSKLGSVIIS